LRDRIKIFVPVRYDYPIKAKNIFKSRMLHIILFWGIEKLVIFFYQLNPLILETKLE